MDRTKGQNGRSVLKNVDITAVVILFFLGVVMAYFAMLQSEMKQKIIAKTELTAAKSADQINDYLSKGIDIIRLASYTLDDMIRNGSSNAEMLDFLVNQSVAIKHITMGKSTGLYAAIGDQFLNGTGLYARVDFVPVERPWYIGAMSNVGRVAVIDPYIDVHTNTVMVTLAKTLCDVKSVAAMDFSMEYLQTLTEELTAGGEADIELILDRKYQVIAHSDRAEVGKNYIAEKGTFGSTLIDNLRSSDEELFSFRFGDVDYVVYAMPVANDWLCLSVFDTTSAYAALRKTFVLTIIVSFLFITVLSFIMGRSDKKARLAQEFNEKAERAAAASEAKSSFLSNMSHEIRTPINAVLGMNEMILRESREQKTLEYAGNIRTAGNTLLGLINDILDFSKIEAGKMEIIPADYDISSLINDLVTMIQVRAEAKWLKLQIRMDEKLPRRLNGDEVRIRQVITNILTNAVKYTKKGSITFRIVCERIPSDPKSVYLNVSVSDTGIGIKPEDIEKLFSEFERIEEKRNRSIEGTGLGMNITKRLLEMMGTSLKVESEYGKGSKFSFRLKQKVVSWEPMGDYETASRAAISERKQYREKFIAPDAVVLVVDDTPMNLTVFKSLLKQTKVQIDTAESGRRGLELAKDKKYDMIFLDHMMPDMDGIETLHELRAEEDNPNLKTPAICLTANAISGAREQYLAAGFDDYLTKPIDTDKLEEMMSNYLPKEKVLAAGEDSAAAEEPSVELPEWLGKIGEIDTQAGLQHCGGVESYLETLKIYGESVASNADEIEGFWRQAGDLGAGDGRTRDLSNTTIKVHALKSMSRAIGAEALGALAEKLEYAGKAGDEATLDAELDGLLARYRALGAALSPLYAPAKEKNEDLPPIPEAGLREAYDALRESAEDFDAESAECAMEYLDGFCIPEEEKERVEQLRAAVRDFEWERVKEILS